MEDKKSGTLKRYNQIWQERPRSIQHRKSAQWWHPSVHHITDLNQILMIVASEEEDEALFLFHEDRSPYKLLQELTVPAEGF